MVTIDLNTVSMVLFVVSTLLACIALLIYSNRYILSDKEERIKNTLFEIAYGLVFISIILMLITRWFNL